MRWIGSIADIGLFQGVARSLGRLVVASAVTIVLSIAYGSAVSRFVLEKSSNHLLNVLLLTGQFFLVFLAGWFLAMLVSSLLFGAKWRLRVLAGESSSSQRLGPDDSAELSGSALGDDLDDLDYADEALEAGFSDKTMQFYGILMGALLAVYAVNNVATGSYFSEYNNWAFALVDLRSPDAESRIKGLEHIHQPVQSRVRQAPMVQAAVVELLYDEDDAVRDWAIWSSGRLKLQAASDRLIELLDSPTDRGQAALALGRIQDTLGLARMLTLVPEAVADPVWSMELLRGIGLAKGEGVIPIVLPLVDLFADEVKPIAWWAMTRTWPRELNAEVEERLLETSSEDERCMLAEAYKFTISEDQFAEARVRFEDTPSDQHCAEIVWVDRPWDGGERAERIVYLVGETVQTKALKVAFNAGGSGLASWLSQVAYDTVFEEQTRILAYRMVEELNRSQAPRPR